MVPPDELASPESLSSAVESVSTIAPSLTGLDKLKAQKSFVEKNDAVPPKDTALPSGGEAAVKTAPAPVADTTKPVVPVAGAAPGVTSPYTPDFKYKASGKEMEIPEKFRALITDKESEEEVKKLFGQAGTLDEVKTDNANLKKTLVDREGALGQYQGGIEKLRGMVRKGDFDSWFKALNVPEEKIFQWVLDKVHYNQLPQDQRAQIDRQRELVNETEQAKTQVRQVSAREMQLATEMKGMQLEQTLGKADVKSMAEAFDARVGRPGAFKDSVIEHGKSVWALSNYTVDLTPEQAVQDFVKKYGITPSSGIPTPAAGAVGQVPNTPAAPAAAPSANAAPPVKVIPNVNGRGAASPVKSKPRNLEDLKRLRDEAIREDNASRSPSQGYLAG